MAEELVREAAAYASGPRTRDDTAVVSAIRQVLAVAHDQGVAGSNACHGNEPPETRRYDTRSKSCGTQATEVSNVISALGKTQPREWFFPGPSASIPNLSEREWAHELGVRAEAVNKMSEIGKKMEMHLARFLCTSAGPDGAGHQFLVGQAPKLYSERSADGKKMSAEPETSPNITGVCAAADRLLSNAGISVQGYQTRLYKALDDTLPFPETFSLRGATDFVGIQRTSNGIGIAIVDLKVTHDSEAPEKSHALQNFIYRQLMAAMAPRFRLKARCYILHVSLTRTVAKLVEIKCDEIELATTAYVSRHLDAPKGSPFWTLVKVAPAHRETTIAVNRTARSSRAPPPTPPPVPEDATDTPPESEDEVQPEEAVPEPEQVQAERGLHIVVELPDLKAGRVAAGGPFTDDTSAVRFLRLVSEAEGSKMFSTSYKDAKALVPADFVSTSASPFLGIRLSHAYGRWCVVRDALKKDPSICTKEQLLAAIRGKENPSDLTGGRVSWGHWVGQLHKESVAIPIVL